MKGRRARPARMSGTASGARTLPVMLLVGAILALVLADAARGDSGSDPAAPSPPDTATGTPSIAAPALPACSAGESEASEAWASSVAQTCTAGGATETTVPDPDAGSPQPIDSWTAAPRAEPAQSEPAAKAAPEPASQALADEAGEAAAPETEAAAASSPSRSDPAQPATETPSSSQAPDCRGADAPAAPPAGDSSSAEGGSDSAGTGDAASDDPDALSASAEEREASGEEEEGRPPETPTTASPASRDPATAPVTEPSPFEPAPSPPEAEAGVLDATEPPQVDSELAGERDPAADALITVLNRIAGERFAHERSFASPPRPRSVLLVRRAPRFALERRTRCSAAAASIGRLPGRAEPRRARKTGKRVGGAPDKKSPLLADGPERSSSGSSTGLSSAVQSPTTPVGVLLTLSPLVPLVGGSRRVPTAARPCHPHVEWVADEKPG